MIIYRPLVVPGLVVSLALWLVLQSPVFDSSVGSLLLSGNRLWLRVVMGSIRAEPVR
jgi:ABC-type spermidine/putrescine transport system permease subunit II